LLGKLEKQRNSRKGTPRGVERWRGRKRLWFSVKADSRTGEKVAKKWRMDGKKVRTSAGKDCELTKEL